MTKDEEARAQSDAHYSHQIETYKSMISISTEGFKYLALLNGGAAAGIVATIDKLRIIMPMGVMRIAVGCFVVGLISNGCGIICAYFTQLALFGESVGRERPGAHSRHLVRAGLCIFLSLAAFCAGALEAVFGINY